LEYKSVLRYLFLAIGLLPLLVAGQGVKFTSLFTKKPLFDEVGFTTGFGFGSNAQSLPEGTYRPIYFMGYFANHLLKPEFRNEAWGFPMFYVEPQFNLVTVQKPNGELNQEIEFGINNGFKQTFKFADFFQIFILVGSGPHFISVETTKQEKGFIFSDCFGAGGQWVFKSNLTLNLGFRLRHMSNAELFYPNGGINTYNYHFGFSYYLK